LAKCLDLTRSGEVDRADDERAAAVLLDSTFTGFEVLRAAVFDAGLELFREPFRDAAFAGFAFRRTDLALEDDRPEAFFVALGFCFALVAINAATYKGYAI
jgi:hypothetical protein